MSKKLKRKHREALTEIKKITKKTQKEFIKIYTDGSLIKNLFSSKTAGS